MCNNSRVLNLSTGHTMKHKQALKGVGNYALAWVESGVSVRALTIAEAIQARRTVVLPIDRIAFAELPGIAYRPTEAAAATRRGAMKLTRVATYFADSISAA